MPEEVREQVFANLPMRSKEQGVADYLVAALHPGLSGMSSGPSLLHNVL